jgi:spermidine synthase
MNNPAPPPRRSGLLRVVAVLVALCVVLVLAYRLALLGSAAVVFEGESDFGRVRVVEHADGLRSLYTGDGRARQSAIYPGHPSHLEIAYTRVATVGLALAPEDGRFLYIGLGGGAMPMFARVTLPDATIEVVEIDPLIVRVAREFFGFRPDVRLAVHTGDGRAFIEQAPPGSYDLVVLDAFSDDEVPYALTTIEFLGAVRASLAPGGVVVSNLWNSSGEYGPMLATYHAVFDQVHLVRVEGTAQRILVAGSAARRLDRAAMLQASRDLARRAELNFDLAALVERGYQRASAPDAPVLRDRAGPGEEVQK